MKKKIFMLAAALLAALGLVGGLVACNKSNDPKNKETTESEMIEYYGCPNSKRIRKLSLKKKKIK